MRGWRSSLKPDPAQSCRLALTALPGRGKGAQESATDLLLEGIADLEFIEGSIWLSSNWLMVRTLPGA